MPAARQGFERRYGKPGCARKHQAQRITHTGREETPSDGRDTRPRLGRRPRGALLAVFLESLADALSLELGEVIDEELAVEMIDLVLDAHCQQAVGVQFELLPLDVLRPDPDAGGALAFVEDPGHRQAALFAYCDSLLAQDL